MHSRFDSACFSLAIIVSTVAMSGGRDHAAVLPPLPDDVAPVVEPVGAARARTRTAEAIRETTGLEFAVVESYIRRHLISTDTPYGFKVRAVRAGSPAAGAGIRPGDVLLTWNDRPVRRLRRLRTWVDGAPDGAVIEVRYARRCADRSLLSRRPWSDRVGRLQLAP